MSHQAPFPVLSIESETLRVTWTWFRGAYTARAGGGIWHRGDGRWRKVAELADGSGLVHPAGGDEHWSDPVDAVCTKGGSVQEVRLTHPPLVAGGRRWSIQERWRIGPETDRIHWQYVFTPAGDVAERCRLGVSFSVLPGTWRAQALPSYCGYLGDLCYAVYPTAGDPWWMRLAAPRVIRGDAVQPVWDHGIRTVHYPMTYRPTKLADQDKPVVLEGTFLVGRHSPAELAHEVRGRFPDPPRPPERSWPRTADLAFSALQRSAADAQASGLFRDDETALTDMVMSDGWKHQHNQTTFGAGFSCGFAGHALLPLVRYFERTRREEARQLALRIARWLARCAQTSHGAYHNLVDMAGPHGFDFLGEDLVHPHITARMAVNMLAVHDVTGDRSIEASARKACEWMLGLQEPDGGLPWKAVGTTGTTDGTEAYAAVTAEVISAWTAAARRENASRYLAAATRLGEWIASRFVNAHAYGGYITDDRPANGLNRWETPSSPAAGLVITGLTNLYRATAEDSFLEPAVRAGEYLLLWQWPWEFPPGCLRIRVRGLAQAAGAWNYTVEQTLGNELPEIIEGFLNLYDCTRDPRWLDAAEWALFRMPEQQFADPNDLKCGTVFEGWNINHDGEMPMETHDFSRGLISGTSVLMYVIERHNQLAPRRWRAEGNKP